MWGSRRRPWVPLLVPQRRLALVWLLNPREILMQAWPQVVAAQLWWDLGGDFGMRPALQQRRQLKTPHALRRRKA